MSCSPQMYIIRNSDCDAFLLDYYLKWGQVLRVHTTEYHNDVLEATRLLMINRHAQCKSLWQIFNTIINCLIIAPQIVKFCGILYHQVFRGIYNRVIIWFMAWSGRMETMTPGARLTKKRTGLISELTKAAKYIWQMWKLWNQLDF